MRALVNHVVKNFSLFTIGVLLHIFQCFKVFLKQLLLVALELFG